jgi:hypothetical protein
MKYIKPDLGSSLADETSASCMALKTNRTSQELESSVKIAVENISISLTAYY